MICHDECHHTPLMFSNKQMRWFCKTKWKGYRVRVCLWSSAFTAREPFSLGLIRQTVLMKNLFLFQREVELNWVFCTVFLWFLKALKCTVHTNYITNYRRYNSPWQYTDIAERWVYCWSTLSGRCFYGNHGSFFNKANKAVIQQGTETERQHGHWHLRILAQYYVCMLHVYLYITVWWLKFEFSGDDKECDVSG